MPATGLQFVRTIETTLARVFWNAWLSAVTPANICGGFKKAGVFLFNRDAVSLPENSSVCSGGVDNGDSYHTDGDGDHADGGGRDGKHFALTYTYKCSTCMHIHTHVLNCIHLHTHVHMHTLTRYMHTLICTCQHILIHTLSYTTRSTHMYLQRLLSDAINL